jgi:FdhD protein
MDERVGNQAKVDVHVVDGGLARLRSDRLATEEPMEIRLLAENSEQTIAITMRTPGADFELAAGFLFGEGVIEHPDQVAAIAYCVDRDVEADQRLNIVTVRLNGPLPDLRGLHRHFYTSSACGVCGKASLDSLELRGYKPVTEGPRVDPAVFIALPDKLRAQQGIFERTGGLHAAAVCTPLGEISTIREDVGRHNAVDKAVGRALLDRALPLEDSILLVSGRTSYEILQKALAARIPIVAGISAPSSLALDVAQRFDITLIGFLRGERFNVYSGRERVAI